MSKVLVTTSECLIDTYLGAIFQTSGSHLTIHSSKDGRLVAFYPEHRWSGVRLEETEVEDA